METEYYVIHVNIILYIYIYIYISALLCVLFPLLCMYGFRMLGYLQILGSNWSFAFNFFKMQPG